MEVAADTTVLIDIWRYRRETKRLKDLRDKLGQAAILVPWITQAEFSRGAIYSGVRPEVLVRFYEGFTLLPLRQGAINLYAHLWGKLARKGEIVDYPDLWIACTALERQAPLATRNPRHFPAIPDLEVISYEIL